MAKLTSKKAGKSIEVKDGSSITTAAEKLGVALPCKTGVCGSCSIRILKGAKNLSPMTEAEKKFDKNAKNRLACQCKIEKGEVVIDY